jgi:hypothetical protein
MHLANWPVDSVASVLTIATCKCRDFREKAAQFGSVTHSLSQKEKIAPGRTAAFTAFFNGTMLAVANVALTISSPETTAPVPKLGRAT